MIGVAVEGGGIDILLIGAWGGADEQGLTRWKEQTPELHEFVPDYHRLCLEYWLWRAHQAGRIHGRIMDVGVEDARRWMGPGYVTLGFRDADITGDLTALPLADGSLDTAIVTEVLEHCEDPFAAAREVRRVLAPGGRLFVTSPFLWPYHGTDSYPDFWRFTHEGWTHLFTKVAPMAALDIKEVPWTQEGAVAYDQLRRWEGFGFRDLTRAASGYLVEAVR